MGANFGDSRLPTRIWDKIHPEPNSGCWLWLGFVGADGYGQSKLGKARVAHRIVYEAMVGEIPEGLVIDHLCRTRCCVNPDHLEPVTHRENLLRGETLASMFLKRTHCSKGHDLTFAYRRAGGSRKCRRCNADSEQLRRDRLGIQKSKA
jgi:hypothetical protein